LPDRSGGAPAYILAAFKLDIIFRIIFFLLAQILIHIQLFIVDIFKSFEGILL